MTLLKLAAGLLSGSLGVLSDAAHSALDLTGSALTFFSVQVSDKPGRRRPHLRPRQIREPFLLRRSRIDGHLLRLDHLGSDAAHQCTTTWNCTTPSGRCWCSLTSIAVDFWRSRQLRAVAERTGSPALATDAFHFRQRHLVDVWRCSPDSAPVGSGSYFHIQWLRYADPFAAVVVSLMILRITAQLDPRRRSAFSWMRFPPRPGARSSMKSSRSTESWPWSRRAYADPAPTTLPT